MQNVCLKIHTNCTRRARWDAKLGYQFKSGPIASSLKAVDPNGGLIGQLCVVVSRIYPIMYREKTADGLSSNFPFLISFFNQGYKMGRMNMF